jgi:hypothetical protein
MLGPARFSHIEVCAQEVCRNFKKKEDLDECISSLKTLDDQIIDARQEIQAQKSASSAPGDAVNDNNPDGASTTKAALSARAKPDYQYTISDLPKVRRLVVAREKTLSSLRSILAKDKKASEPTGPSAGSSQAEPIAP